MLLFPIPLEQESLHQVHLTFPRNSLTHQVLLFIQLSQGNAPAVQKMSRRCKERAGTGQERLYPLHKSHTTQVTASKARQGRLRSPGTPALRTLSSLLNYLRAFGDGPVARVPGGQGIESWLACLEFEPSATKDPPCRAAMHVKSIES
ncbi:hypothetical protein TNCV_901461 [Trichonephila clavipes]|nr:hypothetical protein TNCV_901461 [Trichonephila clavipes]